MAYYKITIESKIEANSADEARKILKNQIAHGNLDLEGESIPSWIKIVKTEKY